MLKPHTFALHNEHKGLSTYIFQNHPCMTLYDVDDIDNIRDIYIIYITVATFSSAVNSDCCVSVILLISASPLINTMQTTFCLVT